MYENFYGLSGKPFSLLPDAGFLYLSKRHKRVVNLLEYSAITQAGFMVISGDVGAGKTTALRHFLKHSGRDIVVGLITNSSKSLGRLFSWVATAFDLNCSGMEDVEIYNHFVDFLLQQYARGKRTVLIIDEAQNLTADMLEDLRMLSNVNNEKDQLLQIILAGQPSLVNTLKHPELQQFVQRISIHCHLTPLDPHETAGYIRHRLSVVGGSPALFDDKACAAVHFFTFGVPRLINLLCDQSMMYAFAEDKESVDFQIIVEVVNDRNKGGLSAFRQVPVDMPESDLLKELQDILDKILASEAR